MQIALIPLQSEFVTRTFGTHEERAFKNCGNKKSASDALALKLCRLLPEVKQSAEVAAEHFYRCLSVSRRREQKHDIPVLIRSHPEPGTLLQREHPPRQRCLGNGSRMRDRPLARRCGMDSLGH